MTEPELLALIGGAGTAIAAGLRWALRLWATVRREDIEAARTAAAMVSADHRQMIDALIAQARSMAELGGKIETLAARLDTLVEWRDRTPVEGYAVPIDPEDDRRRRAQTAPRGYRPPRPGGHDD